MNGQANFFRGIIASEPTIYDDATAIYSLRNYFEWDDAILKIRRSSDNAVKWVFFDGLTITLSSLVGDSRTTSTATTLSSWIGVNDGYVEEWISQTSDNTINDLNILKQISTSLQPKFINSGVIITRNSLPCIFNDRANAYMESDEEVAALSDINTSTIFTVSNNDIDNNGGAIFTNVKSSATRYLQLNDRRATCLFSLLQSSSGTITNRSLNQYNFNDVRLQTDIKKPTILSSYYNGNFETSNVWSGTHTNDTIKIFLQISNLSDLFGTIQEIIIFPSDKTSDLAAIHTDINTYYSIY